MKDDTENSWAPHQRFKPQSSVQQAGILPLDQSNALFIQMNIGATARAIFLQEGKKKTLLPYSLCHIFVLYGHFQ